MNQLTTYREKPLTMEEFSKLEAHAGKYISIKEKFVSKPIAKVDRSGDIYGWEYGSVSCGMEVHFRMEPDERVMESIMRPATRQAIGVHLQRLCHHKPYGRGVAGWVTIIEDMIHDLSGCSEWSIIKACEKFRLDAESKFFPDTPAFVSEVKNLDEQIRWAYAARPASKALEVKPKPEEFRSDRSPENLEKVNNIVADMLAKIKLATPFTGEKQNG